MGRTLVLGDVHGELKKLKEVLKLANLQQDDLVISLGDIVDRGQDPFKCMEVLHELPHTILIKGNHDWALTPYTRGYRHEFNGHHGSYVTMGAWRTASEEMKDFVRRFLAQQVYHYTDRRNYFYVHGGFDRSRKIEEQDPHIFMWDRNLWQEAAMTTGGVRLPTKDDFTKIFIGHTPTIIWNTDQPMFRGNIINVDTGCGKGGKLTIMDVETHQYWQA